MTTMSEANAIRLLQIDEEMTFEQEIVELRLKGLSPQEIYQVMAFRGHHLIKLWKMFYCNGKRWNNRISKIVKKSLEKAINARCFGLDPSSSDCLNLLPAKLHKHCVGRRIYDEPRFVSIQGTGYTKVQTSVRTTYQRGLIRK